MQIKLRDWQKEAATKCLNWYTKNNDNKFVKNNDKIINTYPMLKPYLNQISYSYMYKLLAKKYDKYLIGHDTNNLYNKISINEENNKLKNNK